jgi:hypothetical protein
MGNRREPRAQVRLPVTVYGIDATGSPFKQTAYACDVSRRGARIDGIACLRGPGESVEVEHRGKKAKFLVVWVGIPATPEDGHIGVRLLERNKSIWVLDLPGLSNDDFVIPEPEVPNPEESVFVHTPETSNLQSEEEPQPSAAVAYLRQQKELQQPQTSTERRRYRRYAINGGAELRAKGSPAHTWGPMRDISASGCYVELYVPPAVGSELDLRLEVDDLRLAAEGFVKVVYPGLGIGIEFVRMPDDDRHRLNEFLAPQAAKVQDQEVPAEA